jgi:hypothetical protein
MTQPAGIAKEVYDGNDATTVFPFPHYFDADSEILVTHKALDGTLTVPVLDVDYTVTGEQTESSGSVEFPKGGSAYATLATDQKLSLLRVTPQNRLTDVLTAYHFGVLNFDGDKITRMILDLQEQLDRCAKYTVTNTATPPTLEEIETAFLFNDNGKISFDIDGLGAVLSAGAKNAYVQVPYDGTITRGSLTADQSGDVIVDIWKTTFVLYDAGATHPVVGDSIVAAAPLNFSSAVKSEDLTLVGWDRDVAVGDIFAVSLSGIANITKLQINLDISKDAPTL